VQWLVGDDALPALVQLTGELRSERASLHAVTIHYTARARAWATFDRPPTRIVVDGNAANTTAGNVVPLPAGDHVAVLTF
jgi:hypothetical protein